MITVDTCGITAYSPLIPAIRAMCTASPGETIAVSYTHLTLPIYDGEQMTVQFTINGKL